MPRGATIRRLKSFQSPLSGTARGARPDSPIGARPGRAQANYGFRIVLDLAMKAATTKKP